MPFPQASLPPAARRRRTIAFDAGHLNWRGTDVALFDYADHAERLLGHRSLILAPAASDLAALDRFRARFPVYLYRSREDLEELLVPVDLYYLQVHGARPTELPPKPPRGRRAVHCVFTAHQPYGEVYASISDWVSRERGPAAAAGGARQEPIPTVPYMVHLPAVTEDLRRPLGIPDDDVVFGRHGGMTTFNIPWVLDTVRQVVERRHDCHFVFMNTPMFVDHPRVHHLRATSDLEDKRVFINTCDAMLHARDEGETFGLAIAEFSICNKPVLTWSGGHDRAHIEILGDKGCYYANAAELEALLLGWQRRVTGDLDAYSARFAPEPVMAQFSRVFLGEQEPDRGGVGRAPALQGAARFG